MISPSIPTEYILTRFPSPHYYQPATASEGGISVHRQQISDYSRLLCSIPGRSFLNSFLRIMNMMPLLLAPVDLVFGLHSVSRRQVSIQLVYRNSSLPEVTR